MGVGSEGAHVDGEGVGDGQAVGDACCGGVFRVRLRYDMGYLWGAFLGVVWISVLGGGALWLWNDDTLGLVWGNCVRVSLFVSMGGGFMVDTDHFAVVRVARFSV